MTDKEYMITNGVCRTIDVAYYDPLSIAPYTTYTSSTTVRGIDADVYTYNSSTYNVTLFVEKADNSIPLTLTQKASFYESTNQYDHFVGGVDFDSLFFEIPDVCTPPGVICPGEGVQDLEVYRYHAAHLNSLADQNGASQIGVTAFICQAAGTDAEPTYSWISKYTVSVDTAWGNYGLCNLHNCWTLNPNAVGREYSYGVTEDSGQCAPDSPTFGEWYSFTSVSECPSGVPVGPENNCSWQTKQLLQTIDIDCLKNLGFLHDCKADRGFPFPTATATLQKGFETCPDPNSPTPPPHS
uniref:Uncharacterized protein n=1 Tax=Paramoeba aestuarina TaxID=180227 RepID=A0A7S4NK87_9EUKA|mmetsp:Transcript_18015/g.28190  ORF Transcript_18015/g.28190 Transcript_18015/m.28190 type:complete len:297 (+) Transcript_18015:303-1193(+)|eukprot:CAMPEP_0201534780 /NCGR_PEP_ID=MMETSP0161_2-20130828/57126_1 /ASSEMBLY_ACC=CAM_ASM_000251 /TAXON_ID=180227 /ORGANISM="Neoparamoeba aestuarina, Strain SoJaBio B1-5/56/2" /LENGTH=296 /DNA_ID=CAMNT_0047939583 /DNA_START=287 /DNA_END=1177 /DNA_ORIENTATION=-